MKKNCPYCGRRIPYTTLFHIKKHGTYECTRCKKKSKVKLSSALIISFFAVFLMTVLFILGWCTVLGNANNFAGVVITALILIVFYFLTPLMVSVAPLKEYMKQDKKIQTEDIIMEEETSSFTFNRAAFDEVKRRKSMQSSSAQLENGTQSLEETRVDNRVDNIISSIEKENKSEDVVVPIIENVSERHASSSDMPLHKVSHHQKPVAKPVYEEPEVDENIKIAVPKKKKMPDGTKYTANRKF